MIVYIIDLKDSLFVIWYNFCDLVVCNLFYFKGLLINKMNFNKYLVIVCYEIYIILEEVIDNLSKLLKINGCFVMVYWFEWFLEII